MEKGEFPPVEECLPNESVVVVPVEEVGKCGGTWNKVHGHESLGWGYVIYSIESFLKWNRDASGHIPNLVKSWEWNGDRTEITLHFVEGIASSRIIQTALAIVIYQVSTLQ